MKRRLFTLAAAVSLTLALATAVLWARSYWVSDGVRHAWRSTNINGRHDVSDSGVFANRGLLGWSCLREYDKVQDTLSSLVVIESAQGITVLRLGNWRLEHHPPEAWAPRVQPLGRLGFNYNRFALELEERSPVDFRSLTVPCWFVLLATLALPIAWARRYGRQRRRRRAGRCLRCGYDLRATPDRCPECGTTAGANASKEGIAVDGQP